MANRPRSTAVRSRRPRHPARPRPGRREPEKLRLVNRRLDCLLEDLASSAATPSGRVLPWPPAGREALGTRPGARGDAGPALPAAPYSSHRIPSIPAANLSPAQGLHSDMVQQRGQSLLGVSRDRSPYPVHRLGHAPPTLRPARALAHRVPSLRSTGSAEGRPSLFARFIATMDESDCFVPSIMSFGLLLSHATPGRPPG